MVPSIHSLQEGPRGHTDYKTTRLHSQPTESIRNSPEEANTEKKPSRGKSAKQQNGVFMLRVQIKEQEAEFQGTSPTNFVVVAQNYYLKKTHRTVVGGNMRKV